jgi:ZIP family zinc transporter
VEPTVWTVALAALVTALATGLGALPFLFVRRPLRSWVGISSAAAAGFMVAAAALLVKEGADVSAERTVAGAVVGALGLAIIQRLLRDRRDLHVGAMRGADALQAVTIVAVMTAHSAAEGIGVGVAFGGGEALGILITIAIAVHNIPEGLAISLVLVPRGASVPAAAGWSVFSSLPQPLLAVPAFLFVEAFAPFLPVGLGFAAGAMLWMVATQLVPASLRDAPLGPAAVSFAAAFALMTAFQIALVGL